MMPTLWRWKVLLWVRSLTREEARRPLFKLCLLAWLLSLPAAWSLIQQKASTPHLAVVSSGLLRWGVIWTSAAQLLLAVLLWVKQIHEQRDGHLLSHPASWKALFTFRLVFSTTGASLLFTLGVFAAYHGGLLAGARAPSLVQILFFAMAWTLQAFTLTVLASAALRCGARAGLALPQLVRRAGLAAFFASVFLLTWGGDWLLHRHSLALGLLGSSLAEWSRWAWMPLQVLEGLGRGDWRTLTEAVSVLSGTSFLSVIFLGQQSESAGRLLWPQSGPDQRSRSLAKGWVSGNRQGDRLSLPSAARLFAFKDYGVPLLRQKARGLAALLAPSLLAAGALLLLDSWKPEPVQDWIRAIALLLAAWLARGGLTVWSQEKDMAQWMRPWLPERGLFLAKLIAALTYSLLQALLSLAVVTVTGAAFQWSFGLPAFLLLPSTLVLGILSFLIGWSLKAGPSPQGPFSRQSYSSLAGCLLYWAIVSALLLPPPLGLSLLVLAAAEALVSVMVWRHVSRTEGARI